MMMDIMSEVDTAVGELDAASAEVRAAQPRLLRSDADCVAFLEAHDNYMFDCDGVIWRAGSGLPHAADALALLRSRGKRVFFVTNNSGRSRAEYQVKMHGLGIAAEIEEIIPSGYAAADYLSSYHPGVKKAFVVGSGGICDELNLAGIETVGGQTEGWGQTSESGWTEEQFMEIPVDSDIGAVVCGWDLSFNFRKLSYASLHLQRNPGCVFVATNRDAYDRLPDRNIPGNGAMVAAIEASGDFETHMTGKPSKWLVNRLIDRHNLDRSRTCMVGDRLDTDIAFGNNGDITSVLVLTGCTTPNDIWQLPTEADTAAQKAAGNEMLLRPTVILPFLGRLATAVGFASSL
jgi:phosphoglycolate/pyridoxal phosphate phosphatase family enzyme